MGGSSRSTTAPPSARDEADVTVEPHVHVAMSSLRQATPSEVSELVAPGAADLSITDSATRRANV